MSETTRPHEVESWRADMGKGLFVNDDLFPYWVAADPGPLVEAIDDHMHILWLPLFAKGPAPRQGPPNGEPAPESHHAHDWTRRGADDDPWRECFLCGAIENLPTTTHAEDTEATTTEETL